MKCPFDLPVKAEYSEMSDAHIVIDPHDRVVAYHCNDKSSAYIVLAINSHELHEKLVAMIKQWHAEEFWNDNPKLVMETLWSALKEAENSND